MRRVSFNSFFVRITTSEEAGFVSIFSVITFVSVLFLMFVATQYAHNTVKSLKYARITISMIQNQKSAPTSKTAYAVGASVARINGIQEVGMVSGRQDLYEDDAIPVSLNMQFDETVRPSKATVQIEANQDFLSNFFGRLLPQQHFVSLSAVNPSVTVYNEFDISFSMTGPFSQRGMIDGLLTKFGIPLDPNRYQPDNSPLLDPFSPMFTGGPAATPSADQIRLAYRYMSRLPNYFSGLRAYPRDLIDYQYDRASFRGAETLGPSQSQVLLCDSRGLNNSRPPANKLNEPGFRTNITLPGGEVIRVGPQDQCVLPWNLNPLVLRASELAACSVGYNDGFGEIPGLSCTTQLGALRDGYSDFWLSYKDILENYLLQVDRVANQVVGVFAAGTIAGNAVVGGDTYRGNTILWNGTSSDNQNFGIYDKPIDLRELSFQSFGNFIPRNLNYQIGILRRLKMLLLYPYDSSDTSLNAEYSFLAPAQEDRKAIMSAITSLEPKVVRNAEPFSLGGYNSYELNDATSPYTRNPGNFFTWRPNESPLLRAVDQKGYLPYPRTAILPTDSANKSWNYTMPYYKEIDSQGIPTGEIFSPASEVRSNYAIPFFKALVPSRGGTDIYSAIKDVADLRGAEVLQVSPQQKSKGILVLVTDGFPDRRCNPALLASINPSAQCANVDFGTDIAAIKNQLSRFEASGNTVVILLHILHAGVYNDTSVLDIDQKIDQFAALFKSNSGPDINPNPRGRHYIRLDGLTPAEIEPKMQQALQLIYQHIDAFPEYQD
jgi:hypothetical protein